MIIQSPQLFWISALFFVLLSLTALYCILVSRNLIRILIGVELLTKAVTLLLVTSGYLTSRSALAQALVITLILVEVVVIAVAAGIIIASFRRHADVGVDHLSTLKG